MERTFMRILIVSDSHGRNNYLSTVLDKVGEIDLFLHLGDLEGVKILLRLLLIAEKKWCREITTILRIYREKN